jgi:hypothetical protein
MRQLYPKAPLWDAASQQCAESLLQVKPPLETKVPPSEAVFGEAM